MTSNNTLNESHARLSILIVDDSPDLLFATSQILREAGHEVFEANSGEACLQTVRNSKVQLVLLDVMLGGIDGYEVCKQLKSDPSTAHLYVVMVSGRVTDSENRSEGLELGADGFIVRPISPRELLAQVQAMSRIIQAERQRDELIEELRKALAEIKVLKGLLPVCASCKKVRKDDGYWQQIDVYLAENADVNISHGMCPSCMKALYGDLVDRE